MSDSGEQKAEAEMTGDTKRIRLTRSILLAGGKQAEEGEVHEVELELANWLISMLAAIPYQDEGPKAGPVLLKKSFSLKGGKHGEE
jgi:hypothetical protein